MTLRRLRVDVGVRRLRFLSFALLRFIFFHFGFIVLALLLFAFQPRPDVLGLAGLHVDAAKDRVLALGIHSIGVPRIDLAIVAVEAENVEPVGRRDAAWLASRARSTPRAVVLQAAVNVIR